MTGRPSTVSRPKVASAPWQACWPHPSAAMTGHEVALTCAGRTDAGVHASAQVVHADLDGEVVRKWAKRQPGPGTLLERLGRSLSRQLGPAVAVLEARVAPGGLRRPPLGRRPALPLQPVTHALARSTAAALFVARARPARSCRHARGRRRLLGRARLLGLLPASRRVSRRRSSAVCCRSTGRRHPATSVCGAWRSRRTPSATRWSARSSGRSWAWGRDVSRLARCSPPSVAATGRAPASPPPSRTLPGGGEIPREPCSGRNVATRRRRLGRRSPVSGRLAVGPGVFYRGALALAR